MTGALATVARQRRVGGRARFHASLPFHYAAILPALIATVSVILVSAYSFTRFKYRGSSFLPLFYLVIRMVPRITLVLPFYVIFTQLHLINTREALIVSYTTFALPFGIWMMIGFLQDLPIELEEAAAVDGGNRWQILTRVVVPLAAPGLATTAIFAFLLGWNEFLLALILAGPDSRTLPVLVAASRPTVEFCGASSVPRRLRSCCRSWRSRSYCSGTSCAG